MPLRCISAFSARCALIAHSLLVLSTAIGLADPAAGETLASASYQIVGSHLNGGGTIDLQAAAPGAQVASAGVSLGQSVPLGASSDPSSPGFAHGPGFWRAVAAGREIFAPAVPVMSTPLRWLLAGALGLAALPALRRRHVRMRRRPHQWDGRQQ